MLSGVENIGEIQSFALETLGCKVNRVESETFQALIQQSGRDLASPEEAECIIINTCTVTAEADKKCRKAVRSLLKRAPQACIWVTGCASSINPEMFLALDRRVRIIERMELVNSLKELSDGYENNLLRIGEGFRTRVGVKIQDGCDNSCSYCIVHVARGSSRSFAFDDVINEIRRYVENGIKEIVLTGIDLGAYESDGKTLQNLLGRLLELSHSYEGASELPTRFRASSLEPTSVTEPLIELFASAQGQICRHLHLPLQSGSSKVLKEMYRPYDAEQYLLLIQRIREQIPEISLTTDIICGFPGETDDDFEQTMQLAREARFSKIHVFPYSKREGTPAALRSDQVEREIILERAAQLRELATLLRQEDRQRRTGTSELVLVQDGMGLSESYHEIALDKDLMSGTLLRMDLP